MKRTTTKLVTGLAIGAVVGTAVSMMAGETMPAAKKKLKKNAVRAFRKVNKVVDDITTNMY